MTARERQVDDVTVVDIEGQISDEAGAEILRDTVQRLAHRGRTKVVLNFLDSSYIDSTALGAIVHGYITVRRRGGSLKLLHAQGRVHQLLTITKLATVFETFDSEPEAVSSFTIAPL